MKKPIAVCLMLLLLTACADAGPAWYEGGTLHEADMAAWRPADPADKLATMGDIMVNVLRREGLQLDADYSLDALRALAERMVRAIDDFAGDDPDLDAFPVLDATLLLWELGAEQWTAEADFPPTPVPIPIPTFTPAPGEVRRPEPPEEPPPVKPHHHECPPYCEYYFDH